MGDFDIFTNIHCRNYFELKRKGQMKEALKELQLGCDEEDGQSLYVMAFKKIPKEYLYRSAIANCPWGMYGYASFSATIRRKKDLETKGIGF
jgi:hypothetical protein